MSQLGLFAVISLLLGLLTSGLSYASCDVSEAAETLIDKASNLMWSRCLVGQSGQQCQIGEADKFNWVNTLNKARGSEFAGFKNWRMPKIGELESLLGNCVGQGKDFSGAVDGFIWSASANLDFATEAWAFNLAIGKREVLRRHEAVYVLLVRNIE